MADILTDEQVVMLEEQLPFQNWFDKTTLAMAIATLRHVQGLNEELEEGLKAYTTAWKRAVDENARLQAENERLKDLNGYELLALNIKFTEENARLREWLRFYVERHEPHNLQALATEGESND